MLRGKFGFSQTVVNGVKTLTMSASDVEISLGGDGEPIIQLEIPVAVGTNGEMAAFSKVFKNEELAIQTQFHIAESYFELFKSHRELGRSEEERADLASGRRILREVMEDYPDPKYVPRIAYLLGQFAQELESWAEATDSYEMIVRQFPDHPLAADAQYKLAQSHEEAEWSRQFFVSWCLRVRSKSGHRALVWLADPLKTHQNQ